MRCNQRPLPLGFGLSLFSAVLSIGACSAEAPSQAQINLTAASLAELTPLTTRQTIKDESVTLPAVTIDAKIDGAWQTISDAPRNVELALGNTPAPTTILQKTLPPGALTGLRLHVSSHGRSVDLGADCLGKIPRCASGKIDLVIQNPLACLDGQVAAATLQIVAFDLTPGQCGSAPITPLPDLSSTDADAACVGIVCAPDQVCRGGACFATDSCNDVVCPPGQTCENGGCVAITDMSTPPDLSCHRQRCNDHNGCGE